MSMFCYQCEQTTKSTGCTTFGVCGKDPETAALQDLLVHATKAVGMFAHEPSDAHLLDNVRGPDVTTNAHVHPVIQVAGQGIHGYAGLGKEAW